MTAGPTDPLASPETQTEGTTVSTGTAQKNPEQTEDSPQRGTLTFGKYRLFARLGTGGMADVYLAVAQGAMNVNRLVVIKRLRDEHANDEATREMFVNEARLAARLNHPNVIQTQEAGTENGTYFLAMEYVDGQPMSRLLNKLKRDGKKLDPRIAARIVSDALNGLHYAHELCDFDETPLEIVHRDVSPQNVMITYEGAVKLVDFGIAKAAIGTTQTAHGVFKGKVAFMAPEQVTLEKVDRRADIFAAGIVLWEAVTGKPLMGDSSPAKTLYNLLNKPVPRASSENPDVPAALDDAIMKSLQRNVNDRFQTAKEMRDALEAFIATAGGVSTEEVGKLLKDLFRDTREKVQAQVKAQLKTLSLSRTNEIAVDINTTAIRSTGMLIDLGEGLGLETASNPSLFRVVSTASNQLPPPSRGKKLMMAAWVAVTFVALGASGVAIMRSQKNVTPPVTSVAPETKSTTTASETPSSTAGTATASAEPASSTATTSATGTVSATATATTVATPVNRPTWVAPRQAPPQPVHTAATPATNAEPKTAPTPATTTTSKPDATQQGRTFRREL